MELWTQHPDLTPATLSGYATQVLEDLPIEDHILERWFPMSMNPDMAYEIEVGSLRTRTPAMGFRAFDAEPGPGTRYGFQTKTGKLPPLGRWLDLGEKEVLELMRGSVPSWVRDQVYDDVDNHIRALQNRMELARGKILLDAALTLSGNLSSLSVSYTRNANREVTPGTLWSNTATSTPLTDERTVYRIMRDEGKAPGVAVAPSEVIDVLEVNDEYAAAHQALTGAAAAPAFLTLDEINRVRRSRELPELVRYDAAIEDYSGTTTKVIGVDSLLYLPADRVGETQMGRPLTANLPGVNIVRDQGGPVVFVASVNKVPPSYQVWLDAIGMPLAGDLDRTARFTVL